MIINIVTYYGAFTQSTCKYTHTLTHTHSLQRCQGICCYHDSHNLVYTYICIYIHHHAEMNVYLKGIVLVPLAEVKDTLCC